MSGKAPPTGPRALLNSLNGCPSKRHPPQSDLSSSSHPNPTPSSSSSPTTLINRIGAPPPTGPRSLLNGNTQGRNAKPTLNGHTNPLTGQSRQPPSGPSAMQQKPPHKGKQVEIKWSDQAIASTVSFPPSFVLCTVHSKSPFLFQSHAAHSLNLVRLSAQHVQHHLLLQISMERPVQAGHPVFRRSHSLHLPVPRH